MRVKELTFGETFIFLFFSLLIVYSLIELSLHVYMKKGIYYQSDFNKNIGFCYKPGSRVIYNEDYFVANMVNRDGFLDVNHPLEDKNKVRDPNHLKIAFFGDENVEGIDIPLEKKFFRLLKKKIGNYFIEYFGYGMTGYGTYQSYLNWKLQSTKYKFNLVVYVLSEDDVGDNIYESSRRKYIPHAELSGDNQIVTHYSFKSTISEFEYNNSTIAKFLKTYSLSFFYLFEKLKIANEKNVISKDLSCNNDEGISYPISTEPCDVWPYEIKSDSFDILAKILMMWKKELQELNCGFMVIYIPPNTEYLDKVYQSEHGWMNWVKSFCKEKKIEFIDTTQTFKYKFLKNKVLFKNNHLTIEGHKVLSEIINEKIENKLNGK